MASGKIVENVAFVNRFLLPNNIPRLAVLRTLGGEIYYTPR